MYKAATNEATVRFIFERETFRWNRGCLMEMENRYMKGVMALEVSFSFQKDLNISYLRLSIQIDNLAEREKKEKACFYGIFQSDLESS